MLISHQPRANRQGMGIAVRGLCRCFTHARALGNAKDWGEPPPFWFVRSWETIEPTKFRSFSLVYLQDPSPIRSLVGINR
jgi:hypothetical protein